MVLFEVMLPLESYVNTMLSEKMIVVVFILKYSNIGIWYHHCTLVQPQYFSEKRLYLDIMYYKFFILKVIRLKLKEVISPRCVFASVINFIMLLFMLLCVLSPQVLVFLWSLGHFTASMADHVENAVNNVVSLICEAYIVIVLN